MNFFEHQQAAKSRTRWLLLLFVIAVVLIIVLVDLVLLIAFGEYPESPADGSYLSSNAGGLVAGAVATGLLILLASLFRIFTLSSGGGKVARELGGTLVDADTRDFKRRQLRNVVEEMSIASGIPVPEIYVLEREAGINAFAAGLSTSDAAIAVTRGLLDTMTREELQGVIAHEFSHVLNGDMRINLRLMGVLFGILVLAIIGRKILDGASRARSGKNGAGAAVIGLAVMLIGYVGLFFARWIKAAVSRQREFLADASAVQFTRNPDSIGGALKKIAVHASGSLLQEDTEEIAHMLFGQGAAVRHFATHPPVLDRIRRLQPGFREEELEDVRRRLQRELSRQEEASREKPEPESGSWMPGQMIDLVGQPELQRLLEAVILLEAMPAELVDAAHSVEWAPALLLYTLLDRNDSIRNRQLIKISIVLGQETESQVNYLLSQEPMLETRQRLPLFELTFPAVKRRPVESLIQLQQLIEELVQSDNRVDTYEYLLARLISQHLREAIEPEKVVLSGNGKLSHYRQEVHDTLAVLADHGHRETKVTEKAFQAGLLAAEMESVAFQQTPDWMDTLDSALPRLNLLKPAEKQKLLAGMVASVMSDEKVGTEELELLRVLCGAIHVPLPLLAGQETGLQ